MADFAHLDRLRQNFTSLLRTLAATWPEQDIAYVREEIGHGEFGDALENLIALGLRNGQGFSLDHERRIEDLAAAMGMTESPFLVQLRLGLAGQHV